MARRKASEEGRKIKRDLPTLTIRFTPEVHKVIERLASAEDRSRALWVERLVIQKLRELGEYPDTD